jgi:uncharacterized membrane protein
MNQTNQNKTKARFEILKIDMDVVVGYVLLGGVVLSTVLITAGFAWHWMRTGHLDMEYTISGMNLVEFIITSIRQAIDVQFRPRLLVSLGIAALMLTPFLRVLVSMLFFAFVEHNWKYSIFTCFVFIVLTYSLFLG